MKRSTKFTKNTLITISLGFSILITACSRDIELNPDANANSETTSSQQSYRKTEEVVLATEIYSPEEINEYDKEVAELLANYKRRIQQLETAVKTGAISENPGLVKEIQALKKHEEILERKFVILQTTQGKDWVTMKENIDLALKEINMSLEELESFYIQ